MSSDAAVPADLRRRRLRGLPDLASSWSSSLSPALQMGSVLLPAASTSRPLAAQASLLHSDLNPGLACLVPGHLQACLACKKWTAQ